MTELSRQPETPGLLDEVSMERQFALAEVFPRATIFKVAALAAIVLALNFTQIRWMVLKWGEPNWAHGYLIPLFSLFLLYSRRDDLFDAILKTRQDALARTDAPAVLRWLSPRGDAWGVGALLLIGLSLLGEAAGILWLRNYFTSQVCMVLLILGLTLYFGGPRVVRVTWLPILYLLFAVPLPDIYYSRLSFPLQNISAKGAVAILRLFHVDIVAVESQLKMLSRSNRPLELTVAEACSGIRLLWAFMALGVAMAYLDAKPIWQRVILVAAGIPIAIFCNMLRVAITCTAYWSDNEVFGQDFMHTFTGMLMLVPALLLLWLLSALMRKLFVERETQKAGAA